MEIPSDVRCATAPSAPDLKHMLSRQINQSTNVMIELDCQAIWLIICLQDRLWLVAVPDKSQVHEGHVWRRVHLGNAVVGEPGEEF